MSANPTIMHVIGQLIRGGAERQLITITKALKERGWSQTIVSLSAGDAWDTLVEANGIPLLRIQPSGNKLWRLGKLYALVVHERPRIIHSWSWHTNIYTAGLLLYPGAKRLLSFRGNPLVNNRTGQRRQHVRFSFAYRFADLIVSNSQAAVDFAKSSGLATSRFRVVENVVIAQGRAHPGEHAPIPRIVAAGILVRRKAYDVLLNALGILAKQGQSFELSLAGEGPERSRLEALAESLGISQFVHFLGEVDDVPSLFAKAHLLVHPSVSEGMSNSILEAMAEGLPVIAMHVDGNLQLIDHEQNGLLVPVNDVESLARAIQRLLTDPDLRVRLGQNGLEMVRARFGAERVVCQYENIYHSLVSR